MSDTTNGKPHTGGDSDQGNLDEATFKPLATLISDLAQTMRANNLTRLALRTTDLRITLDAASSSTEGDAFNPQRPVSEPVEEAATFPADQVHGHIITAPMIGTFYAAPAPNEPPFVDVGDQIEEGQTIGIIEAMKIMNEIAADCSGEVIEIVAGNGETVEYGSPLVIVAPFET